MNPQLAEILKANEPVLKRRRDKNSKVNEPALKQRRDNGDANKVQSDPNEIKKKLHLALLKDALTSYYNNDLETCEKKLKEFNTQASLEERNKLFSYLFEKKLFNFSLIMDEPVTHCAICMDCEENEEHGVMLQLKCKHHFHKNCLSRMRKPLQCLYPCPLCRKLFRIPLNFK